jgi:hypothetical protein
MEEPPTGRPEHQGMPSTAVQAGTAVVQTGTVVLSRAISLYPLRLLVPTAAFIVTLVVIVGIGVPGDTRFYQAAATIIVVLVLSLATQGQFFRLDKLPSPPPWIVRLGRRGAALWTLSARLTALALLGYLGLGEGAALYTLANGSGSALLLGLSAAAMASGFFAIGVLAVVGDPAAAELAEGQRSVAASSPTAPVGAERHADGREL